MSFGGHVQDMINRVKQNASLKNARRNKFKPGSVYSSTKNIKTEYNFPKLSEKELTKIKLEIKNQANKEQKKRLLFWVITFVLIIIIWFILFFLF